MTDRQPTFPKKKFSNVSPHISLTHVYGVCMFTGKDQRKKASVFKKVQPRTAINLCGKLYVAAAGSCAVHYLLLATEVCIAYL